MMDANDSMLYFQHSTVQVVIIFVACVMAYLVYYWLFVIEVCFNIRILHVNFPVIIENYSTFARVWKRSPSLIRGFPPKLSHASELSIKPGKLT